MVVELTIRRGAALTVRRQIELLMLTRILAGEFRPGSRLPSIRRLAERTGTHRNTVAAAYRALASTGIVVPRAGSGMYVPTASPPTPDQERITKRSEAMALAGEPELASLLAAELRASSGQTVHPVTIADLDSDRTAIAGRHVLTTPIWLQAARVSDEGSRPARVTCLFLDPLQNLGTKVRVLRAPASIAVVSSSAWIRELVTARVWQLRVDIAVCRLANPRSERARRVLAVVDLALADRGVYHVVRRCRMRTGRPTIALPLISSQNAGFGGSGNLLRPIR